MLISVIHVLQILVDPTQSDSKVPQTVRNNVTCTCNLSHITSLKLRMRYPTFPCESWFYNLL